LTATGIRQLAPGGKARAFGDVVANELAELENRQFLNIAQSLLPFATDTSLDLIGEIFGVPRLAQQTASVDLGDQNFEWYVRSGTFGDINGGQDIVIPDGVRLYTAAGVNGPVYVADAVTLPAAAGSQFFTATSLYSGAAGNAPSSIFSTSNFTGYTESRYGSLLVTNNYGIVGGRDAESDDDYRYRIRLKLQSQNGANEAALRFCHSVDSGNSGREVLSGRGNLHLLCLGHCVGRFRLVAAIDNTVAFPWTGVADALERRPPGLDPLQPVSTYSPAILLAFQALSSPRVLLFHHGPQDLVDPGRVSGPVFLEPVVYVPVDACGHQHLPRGPEFSELFIGQFRDVGVIDAGIIPGGLALGNTSQNGSLFMTQSFAQNRFGTPACPLRGSR
jgi:hypothetical protein